LYDCYGSFSYAKAQAFEYCKELKSKYNGRGLKIIGYNSNRFSAGFIGEIENREAFFYITADYDRYIFLDEIN
jgi:glutathione peroxidase-family protein